MRVPDKALTDSRISEHGHPVSCGWNTGVLPSPVKKSSSPCRTSLVTYFGVAASLPLLIFPSTRHSFTCRCLANTPVPRGRQAPNWHLPGLDVLPRNSGWLWGPRQADQKCRHFLWLSRRSFVALLWPRLAQHSGKRSSSIKTFDISFYGYLHSVQRSWVRKLL